MKSTYTETEMSLPNVLSQRIDGLITSSLIRKEKKVQLKSRNYLHDDVQRSMRRKNDND